jgi:uncharacterized protein (TIGR02145 family)
MKQFLTFLFSLFLFSGLDAQNLPSYLPANGLVGWWPFNGNAQDESGNGNHGTVNGATLTADRFGNGSSAMEFNLYQYIEVVGLYQNNLNGYSISAWFRRNNNNSNTDGGIVSGSNPGQSPGGFRLNIGSINRFQWQVEDSPGQNGILQMFPGDDKNYCDDTWHHVTGTFYSPNGLISSSAFKIYVDGSLVQTISNYSNWPTWDTTTYAPVNNGSRNLIIGNCGGLNVNFTNSFLGTLDDIAIYNRALSQQEITALYQAGNSTSLQYQLQQQKEGNCPTSPVRLFVKTQPRIFTDSVGSINSASATVYGSITNDGGQDISSRGICWSTSPNPTTDLSTKTQNGSGMGSFSGNLSGLGPNTTYYARAYAISAAGTWYGNERTFTTTNAGSNPSATCGTPNIHNPNLSYGSMSDQDGNLYKTIVIGTQEWMAENLKTGHYRNGDLIPVVTDGAAWTQLNTGASCWFNNDSVANDCPYGRLYNWYSVIDQRGLCPVGWHVPTDNEWFTLENFVDPTISDPNATGIRGTDAAKKLRSLSSLWALPNAGSTNQSGFSGLPSGFRNWAGPFYYSETSCVWWSTTMSPINNPWVRILNHNLTGMNKDINFGTEEDGFSVRCLKD